MVIKPNGNVTWKQAKTIAAIVVPALVAVVLSIGGLALANRDKGTQTETRVDGMSKVLDKMDAKLDRLLEK